MQPIDSFILSGLEQKVRELLCPRVTWVSGEDDIRVLARKEGAERVVYPYSSLRLTQTSLSEDRNNLHASALRGTRVGVSPDLRSLGQVRFLPVDFSVSLRFVASSLVQVQRFQNTWLFAAKDGKFSFDVQYGTTTFGVQVLPDKSFSLPTRPSTANDQPEYVVESNLMIRGFISDSKASDVGTATEVEVSLLMGDGATIWKYPS